MTVSDLLVDYDRRVAMAVAREVDIPAVHCRRGVRTPSLNHARPAAFPLTATGVTQ